MFSNKRMFMNLEIKSSGEMPIWENGVLLDRRRGDADGLTSGLSFKLLSRQGGPSPCGAGADDMVYQKPDALTHF